MSPVRRQLAALLHHASIKFASLSPSTILAIYMAPGAFGLMVAKSKLFGISEDSAVWVAVASFVYMSMPALGFLVFSLVTRGTRFRLQILLIVLAIIGISVGLAFWMADIVPMPK